MSTHTNAIAIGCVASLAACHTPSNANGYPVTNSDGTYDLYSDVEIANAVGRASLAEVRQREAYFRLGHVPGELIDRARRAPGKIVSFSLAEATHAGIEVEVNRLEDGRSKLVTVHPGDPGVTGVGQVWVDSDRDPICLFDLGRWVRYPNGGPRVKNVYTTGLRLDPAMPPVRAGERAPAGL
jgi:hypothetical protein